MGLDITPHTRTLGPFPVYDPYPPDDPLLRWPASFMRIRLLESADPGRTPCHDAPPRTRVNAGPIAAYDLPGLDFGNPHCVERFGQVPGSGTEDEEASR